jgi:ABC-type phosphate/phosphonate transport system substrate-binding protein
MGYTVSLSDDIRKMKIRAIAKIKEIIPAVSEGIKDDLDSKLDIKVEVSETADNSGVVESALAGKKEYKTIDELEAKKTDIEKYIKDLDAVKITKMVKTYGSL